MNRRTDSQSFLAKWATLGQQLTETSNQSTPTWLPVKKIIDAARPFLQENREQARRLLALSNQYFAPLQDPFETDFGLHRWLNAEREEAYSDWLAWIIEQLKTPERIVQLLCGESSSELAKLCVGPLRIEREIPFTTGENVRRTDIEISFGTTKAILVEVKS